MSLMIMSDKERAIRDLARERNDLAADNQILQQTISEIDDLTGRTEKREVTRKVRELIAERDELVAKLAVAVDALSKAEACGVMARFDISKVLTQIQSSTALDNLKRKTISDFLAFLETMDLISGSSWQAWADEFLDSKTAAY